MKLIKFSKIGKREVNQDYVLVENINNENVWTTIDWRRK